MLRHPPKFRYSGMTIIMSNPSRFDTLGDPKKHQLISAQAGSFFDKECLGLSFNRHICDIRLIDDPTPLLPETKVCLLLGEKAHRLFTKANTSVDENRGSPIVVNGIPTISSFTPQDAMDCYRDYESERNPHHETIQEFLTDELASGEIIAAKGKNKTARRNYRHWLKLDTQRAIQICKEGKLPLNLWPDPEYILRPSSREIIELLTRTSNDYLHIDIETDFQTLDIRCISFAFESDPTRVYVFPVFDINYKPAYDSLHLIFRAIAISFAQNTVVAHNGALFDFFVFAYKYHIAIGRVCYDTMVAEHRINPDVEKSLGHCVSKYTWLPYHKNEGNHSYRTNQQADELMLYCGKDVFSMMLVKKAQEQLMEKDAGLKEAITWSNRAIRPYLTQSFLGMKYNEELRQKWIKKNDSWQKSLLKIMQLLTGTSDQLPLISNKKCVEYFHGELGYKSVKQTKKGPSLDEDALLKLKQLHQDNIVIDVLLKYRSLKKQTGTLGFKPWIKLPDDARDYTLTIEDDQDYGEE